MYTNRLLQSVQVALENKTQRSAILAMDEVADYCIKNVNEKLFKDWSQEMIRLMVAYHWAKKTLIVSYDEGNHVNGLFMWYNCNEDDGWDFITNWEEDKEDGDAIFLAFISADSMDIVKENMNRFVSMQPDLLSKKLIAFRLKNGIHTKMNYNNRIFKKILKS